jgi:hypothetical protein
LRVQVGSSKQTFNLLIDTGSSWNWINACNFNKTSDAACPEFFFNPNRSSSLQCSGDIKKINYGLGETEGYICTDSIEIDGLGSSSSVKMPLIMRQGPVYIDQPNFDGILGLSPQDESAGPLIMNYLFS